MSIEAVQAFREQVSASDALQASIIDALRASDGSTAERIVDLGRRNGFDFSAADVDAVLSEDGELSDLELELVSAGTASCPSNPRLS